MTSSFYFRIQTCSVVMSLVLTSSVFRTTVAESSGVMIRYDGQRIVASIGDRKVLQYNTAIVKPPEGIPPELERSGQIHPLFSPSGSVLTDDYAPSHAHQHGIMFAWRNAQFKGRNVNFWEQQAKTGNVLHDRIISMKSGSDVGKFVVGLKHLALNGEDSEKVIDETWSVQVYNQTDIFMIDLESIHNCVTDSPLTINEYHYGGFAIRGNRNWDQPSGNFMTDEGKDRSNGNHSRPKWTTIYGNVDGKIGGVTIMGHPSNFRFPQPVRLHPSMPYFCFAPMALGEFKIEKGTKYVSRYRILAHDGMIDRDRLDAIWAAYKTCAELQAR